MSVRAWRWYLIFGVALSSCYPLVTAPIAQDAVYLAVGVSALLAVAVGIRVHRPAAPHAWYLLLAGMGAWVGGDATDAWLRDIAHSDTYPSAADGLYLLAYPIIAAGLWALHRRRTPRRDVGGLVDSAILTVGAGVVSWAAIEHPTLSLSQSSWLAAVVSIAYPAADILLLAILIRLITGGGGRTTSVRLLIGAFALLIIGDTTSSAVSLWSTASNSDYYVIYLLSYVAWGTAALHPSMTRLADPCAPSNGRMSTRRFVALSVAVCVSPGLLAVEAVTGARLDIAVVIGGSAVVFLLVVLRMRMAITALVEATAARDRMADDLTFQATHDRLTGLPNRAHAIDAIERAQARAQRSGTLLVLLFIDLDGFKTVNDTLGHAAGDDVLRTVGRRLREQVRGGDLVARLGGDEFVVVLEDVDHDAVAADIAQRIVDDLHRPMTVHDDASVQIGASIGLALSQDGGIDPDRLLNEADIAVYRAKHAGKGTVEIFDDTLRRELAHRDQINHALAAAIADDQLAVVYQPIVDLATGCRRGYEALVRWHRPGHGWAPPDSFIPLAEQSDLICDLGAWMLDAATSHIATLADTDCSVAVNISGRHVSAARILDDVSRALRHSGLSPHRLVIEITETVLSNDIRAADHLTRLRELGVGVSLDDFGTGYSSISRLRHLPVDTVKIDRSFVVAGSDSDTALLEVMVRAAHTAGFTVIGEGVETPEQVDTLRRLGCDAAQGFLLSRPLSSDDLKAQTRRERSVPQ